MTECATSYDTLLGSFGSASETWDLVCFSIEQIFLNEFTSALTSMVEKDFTDPHKLAIDIVRTNLKCMSVVDAFNETGIKKTPVNEWRPAALRFKASEVLGKRVFRREDQGSGRRTTSCSQGIGSITHCKLQSNQQ